MRWFKNSSIATAYIENDARAKTGMSICSTDTILMSFSTSRWTPAQFILEALFIFLAVSSQLLVLTRSSRGIRP